ncbi:TPA: fimbrial protein [Enterobacter chuandaensis]|uniref:fimbrial protein n=1 Tax=Enterobacter nematophilus TaxID=2994648 RepID=UPI0032F26984|nr:fimbrial protein [Enterobacter chuandaensis]
MSNIIFFRVIFSIVFFVFSASSYVFAESNFGASNGFCKTTGGPKQYIFDMGAKTITDPSQDTAGTLFKDIYTWAASGNFTAVCNCVGTYTPNYKATSSLPLGHTDGSEQYYKLGNSLEVSTKIYLISTESGTNYFPVPFQIRSKVTSPECNGHSFASGSDGKVSVYFARPFIGTEVINSTKIASLYISSGNMFGSEPVADIVMSGTFIVPQTCAINNDKPIIVDLGSVMANDFKSIGAKPEHYNPKTFSFNVKCNNMSAFASLKINITATPAKDLNSAIATTNESIGVILADSNGTPVSINNPDIGLPFILDESYSANLLLSAWPVLSSGTSPVAGNYTGIAELRVNFN